MICWVIVWCDADTFEGGGKKTNSRLAFALTFPLTFFNDNIWAAPPFSNSWCIVRWQGGFLDAFLLLSRKRVADLQPTHISLSRYGGYTYIWLNPFFHVHACATPFLFQRTPDERLCRLSSCPLSSCPLSLDANICYPISMIATLYINDTENLYEYRQLYRWCRYWFPILRISIPVVGIVDKAPALE